MEQRVEKTADTTNIVLMPVAYNDGTLVPDETFDRLTMELTVMFGGYTWLPPAFGGWIDTDGKFQPEKHRLLFLYVKEGREEELDEWVRKAGRELGQDVMLVMRGFCRADFIDIRSEPW